MIPALAHRFKLVSIAIAHGNALAFHDAADTCRTATQPGQVCLYRCNLMGRRGEAQLVIVAAAQRKVARGGFVEKIEQG